MSGGSARFKLNSKDLVKIAKGFGIGAAGSVVAYAGQEAVPALQSLGLPILIPLVSSSVNMLIKWLQDQRA